MNSINCDRHTKLEAPNEYCGNYTMQRRRQERSVSLVTDNVELQDENKPTNKNRDRPKEIKLTPSGNQIKERYQNDQEVSCDKILTCSSSNNHFDSASEYINTSITGMSMVSGVHIVDNEIDYEDKVSRSMPQKSSFRSCKKQKVVRNMDDQVSMSFKSFAEQYSIYSASIAGKEDLENLRQLVRNKTSVGKSDQGEITVNSCSNILHKQKSIDVLGQQNDTEKYVSPLQNNFSYIDSNILKTPSSLVGDSITSVPLSGIKKLASTPGNFLALTQKETTDSVTKSGHKRNDFEFNKPSLVFRGVVAFIDVRSELFDNSQGVKEVMSSLGATVEKTFNKQVTHVIFKDGTLATYSKAKKLNIPLISILWVEACKKEQTLLPFETFVPFGLEKYDHLVTHTRKKYLKMAFTDCKKLRNTKRSKMWDDELVIDIYSETDKDSAAVMCCTCAAEQYPVEDTKKHCTCVEKQSTAEDRERCNITLKKRQKLREKFRSALKTIVPSGPSNKGDGKLEEDLHSNKSSDESSCKVDDSCLESLETLSKVNRKSAPPRLITIRKSRRKKLYCKESIQGCRKNLDTLPTDSDVSSSARNDILKTDKPEYTISVDGKNNHSKSKECYDDKYRPVCTSDTVKNKNFVPECDRNIIMYSKDDKVESDKKTGQDCVNNKVTVGSLKEVTVKKRKRKLLPLESNICINSQLDCTADMSLCSPYYESTPYKDTSGIDEPVLVSESRCIISEDIIPSDKVEQEVHSFLRKESCALFIENKSRKRDFGQRLMATIVCTSMSHKDVEEVESVVRKLGRFRVENKVSHRTTHVVTCKPRRTMNLLKGIARGCWILFQDWVTKSGVAEKWLNEERFELTVFSSAVKQCRLERQAFGPLFSLELFAHVGMIYVCHGTSPSKCDLIELLQLCGGNIVNNIDIANIVIGKGIQQSESRPLLVSEKWILDSVTRNTQLDPHRYKIVTSD